jgi:hypothetical protein
MTRSHIEFTTGVRTGVLIRNATLVYKDPEFEQVEATLKMLKLPYKAIS